jgi:hypothetical protein
MVSMGQRFETSYAFANVSITAAVAGTIQKSESDIYHKAPAHVKGTSKNLG